MNKHLPLLLLSCLLMSFSATSQFNIGDRLVGGAINSYFNSSNYLNLAPSQGSFNNTYGTTLLPRYSWVNKNNVMNGIFLSGSYDRSKNTDDVSNNTQVISNSSFGAGYFIRSFKDFTPQLGWFLEYNATLSYSVNKTKYEGININNNTKYSYVSAGINVAPGLYYRLSPKVVIEAGFGGLYSYYKHNVGSNNGKSESFSVGLNFPSNFTFGLQFLLHHKQNKE